MTNHSWTFIRRLIFSFACIPLLLLESSSKKQRLNSSTIKRAIAEVGLTKKAIVKGRYDLSLLSNKERVTLLGVVGQEIGMTHAFESLAQTALALRNVDIKDMDKLSTPKDSDFPVVHASDLYIRQTYKDLYDKILQMFKNSQEKQIVVTGTAGIGKSVFLIYLAIRLLAESNDDNPPIIIYHTKSSKICFVFGGCSTVRSGNIEDFAPFLTLADTWYFVDSSLGPVLDKARTVISVSPKTLFSEDRPYQDIDKDVAWRYYMAPWNLEELEQCRSCVADFQVVPLQVMEELYSRIGGVPRYVLARPMKVC